MAVAAQRIPKGAAQTGHLSPARPVAGYLRSATELEGDSLRKQLEAVLRCARDRDLQLIRFYCAVLLLDPGRWSRSLTPDHGPYLEDRRRKAGIRVHYCAEGLVGEEAPYSGIVKSLKRAGARDNAAGQGDGRPRP